MLGSGQNNILGKGGQERVGKHNYCTVLAHSTTTVAGRGIPSLPLASASDKYHAITRQIKTFLYSADILYLVGFVFTDVDRINKVGVCRSSMRPMRPMRSVSTYNYAVEGEYSVESVGSGEQHRMTSYL